jgi:4-amino-4-deoxychorismate lyase
VTAGPGILVDGNPGIAVSALDRGLAYGDGLFETILCVAREPTLWSRHFERLLAGCERLGLDLPDARVLAREIGQVAGDRPRCVAKIVLTRGPGLRGYGPPPEGAPTRIVSVFDEPAPFDTDAEGGIAVRWCSTRLGVNPALGGIKHLNRLEQVLARGEWTDAPFAEGLMRDVEDRVVSAIAANLFLAIGGRLHTPRVDRCGVAGVARRELIVTRPTDADVVVRDMLPADVESADEVFLCNSVRGVVPVTRVGGRGYAVGPLTRAAQAQLARAGVGTAP